jgi:SatD family (SatD)/Bacterial regulatory proteins, luxR family
VSTKQRGGRWIAIIGDMVHSRALTPVKRAAAQRDFAKLIALLNRRFRRSVASRFVITLGDEFQGLLLAADVIPEIVWAIENEYHQREVRLGFGFGKLHTPMQSVALNIDGPVLHNARAAITLARNRRMLGGVFEGFAPYDGVLTGFAQILRHTRQHMTARQRTVIALLREGQTQMQIAAGLGISKQAVSDHAIAAGWESYRAAEAGWKEALDIAARGMS